MTGNGLLVWCVFIFLCLIFVTAKNTTTKQHVTAEITKPHSQYIEDRCMSIKVWILGGSFNNSYNVDLYDDMLMPLLPVYTYKDGERIEEHYHTDQIHFYKGADHDCGIQMKFLSTRSLNGNCFISIMCSDNLNYDVRLSFNETLNDEADQYIGSAISYHTTKEGLEFTRPRDGVDMEIIRMRKRRSGNPNTHELHHIDVKYIELFFVHSHDLYENLGTINENIARSIDIANLLDTIYRTVGVRVVLVGVEIWNENNKINVTSNGGDVIKDFMDYAGKNVTQPDNVYLLTTQVFENSVVGLGYVGAMCSNIFSGGFSRYNTQAHISYTAGTIAHEIGHNLGMKHDDQLGIDCACAGQSQYCIMYSYSMYPTPKYFSECSKTAMYAYLATDKALCLANKPNISMRAVEICGNNIVEGNEECDCGTSEFCTNTCCDPGRCKLTTGSECAHGTCCVSCKVASNTTMCRRTKDECDLGDFCDGLSPECIDTYKENGTACSQEGICIGGKCHSRTHQCKYLWGEGSIDADHNCYEVNTLGKSYGHCGLMANNGYKKCTMANIKCGKLHCMNVTSQYPVVGFQSGRTKISINIYGVIKTCFTGTADAGRQQKDPGLVFDWTPCGNDQYCINDECVTKNMTSTCNPLCAAYETCSSSRKCVCTNGVVGRSCNTSALVFDNLNNDDKNISDEISSSQLESLDSCIFILSHIVLFVFHRYL